MNLKHSNVTIKLSVVRGVPPKGGQGVAHRKQQSKFSIIKKMPQTSSSYQENLFYGASQLIMSRAGELRKKMTPAEIALWKHLKNKQLSGLRFRRQHPIDIFIVDFYCHYLKLVIELDRGIHKEPTDPNLLS
jgi:hypothetical protein